MHPSVLFWMPAVLRLSILLLCAVVVWQMFGLIAGMLAGFLAMSALVGTHLHYLYRLNGWLDNPDITRLPDGWGAWADVFSRLQRLRREDERNRAELSEWLTRFRQAMSLLPDGVVIMDEVLFLEWCNPAAQTHLGLNHMRDRGRRVTNMVRDPEFMDYIIMGRFEQPLTLMRNDRKLIVHIIPFENRRQILVTHDATESERTDMMRRDFVANASHELRTPLTVINGFLEIADSQPDLDLATRQAHLQLMIEQGQRMQHLVEDMLTLTRLESLENTLRTEQVDIRRLVDKILQEGQALSGGRHAISATVDGPDIEGNFEELRSAFGNLVSNAVRYTPDHGRIDIAWRNTENGPEFSVRDSGIGVHPDHIARLTERFYRVDKGRSRQTKGTGLGLAIVKHVLLRHEAVLAIESKLDCGSTFVATFPKRLIRHAGNE